MGITGNIPDKIIFVCGTWVNEDTEEDGLKEIYPVAIDNKKRLESARSWAEGTYYHRTKKRTDKIKEIEFDNEKGFKNIRIRNLEVRGEGGRAYKIIVEGKYLTDMRENELMEVILGPGISKGGILNGEFVFGTVGSQNKVMLKGGETYTKIKKYISAKNTKKIPLKDLEFATLYTNASGNIKEVYLGECKLIRIEVRSIGNVFSSKKRIRVKIIKGKHLWSKYYSQDGWEKGFTDSYFFVSFKKTHSMIKKIKTFKKISYETIRNGLINANKDKITYNDISFPYKIDEDIILSEEIIEKYKKAHPNVDVSELEQFRNTKKVSKFSVISK